MYNTKQNQVENDLYTVYNFSNNFINGWEQNGGAHYVQIDNFLLIGAGMRYGNIQEGTIIATGLPTGYYGICSNPSYDAAGGSVELRNGNLQIAKTLTTADARINIIAFKYS